MRPRYGDTDLDPDPEDLRREKLAEDFWEDVYGVLDAHCDVPHWKVPEALTELLEAPMKGIQQVRQRWWNHFEDCYVDEKIEDSRRRE